MAPARSNVSNDLVWQLTRNQNAYLVRRNTGGGAQFSRDPLNLVNKQSFKYAGYANSKAIGIQGTDSGDLNVVTKKTSSPQHPAKTFVTVTYGPKASIRKIYKGVADKTAKSGYRADLREEAVARVSAVRQSQRPKKETPVKAPRGVKARKAAEKASE
ncbi:60S ribosomal protein L28 [Penicillium taxi]|uniref:60S ribosomal protein L28 n=1 Tax=Penicillium taxi TaxID=168475 RepID=UPI00254528B7|nr:60S ribosomal protein L28 [Penicillium taxi]KAJ5902492.1 60S ribosomal protein L28 [Penicillium taxi]